MERNTGGAVYLILGPVLTAFLLTGCAGAWAPPKYQGPGGQITDDMIPVKNEEMKFDFLLPVGWIAVPEDESLPDFLEVPRGNATETGMGVWRKGDMGSLLVWCDVPGQTPYLVEQSLYKISPSSEHVLGPIEVGTSGWNPVFHRYDSSMVEKGQKTGFSFFMGSKSQKLTSLFGCNYQVVARSSTLEDSPEIESDFIAILKSLKN